MVKETRTEVHGPSAPRFTYTTGRVRSRQGNVSSSEDPWVQPRLEGWKSHTKIQGSRGSLPLYEGDILLPLSLRIP